MCDMNQLKGEPPICLVSPCSCFPFQVVELIRNPDMLEKEIHNEGRALDNLQPEQDNPETVTVDSDGLQTTETKRLKSSQVQVWDNVLLTDLSG